MGGCDALHERFRDCRLSTKHDADTFDRLLGTYGLQV
jgi:hypothetical protein